MAMMDGIKKFAMDRAYDYIEHDPEQNVLKLMDMSINLQGTVRTAFLNREPSFVNF